MAYRKSIIHRPQEEQLELVRELNAEYDANPSDFKSIINKFSNKYPEKEIEQLLNQRESLPTVLPKIQSRKTTVKRLIWLLLIMKVLTIPALLFGIDWSHYFLLAILVGLSLNLLPFYFYRNDAPEAHMHTFLLTIFLLMFTNYGVLDLFFEPGATWLSYVLVITYTLGIFGILYHTHWLARNDTIFTRLMIPGENFTEKAYTSISQKHRKSLDKLAK